MDALALLELDADLDAELDGLSDLLSLTLGDLEPDELADAELDGDGLTDADGLCEVEGLDTVLSTILQIAAVDVPVFL